MLNVYAASERPYYRKAIEYNYIDMGTQPESVVKKVVDINGGNNWGCSLELEYDGKWEKKRFA